MAVVSLHKLQILTNMAGWGSSLFFGQNQCFVQIIDHFKIELHLNRNLTGF